MQSRNGVVRVALVTATAGYYHQSIPTAERILHEIAQRDGQLDIGTVVADVASLDKLTPEILAEHDLLCFVSTSGELPLTDAQKVAILEFVAGGKGFVGVHCAAATLKTWEEYGQLLGSCKRTLTPFRPRKSNSDNNSAKMRSVPPPSPRSCRTSPGFLLPRRQNLPFPCRQRKPCREFSGLNSKFLT